jgi:hypothetical protein
VPLLFSNTPGVVAAVVTGPALPFAIAVGGVAGVPAFPGYVLAKSIITGFAAEAESGLGVSHTLRDRIYIYIHGERAGAATVSGLTFSGTCDPSTGAPGSGPVYTGWDAVYSYYERVRASTQGLPVRLVLGPATVLSGFMSKLTLGFEDPSWGIGSFQFRFVTMPRNAGRFGYLPPLVWDTNPLGTPPTG